MVCRYGGMFVMGMAYRGTANNGAIQKLLHFAVSDVSDDVRRAAVLNLGFLLMGVPDQCPPIVALLSESYNPHVRYGAALTSVLPCTPRLSTLSMPKDTAASAHLIIVAKQRSGRYPCAVLSGEGIYLLCAW